MANGDIALTSPRVVTVNGLVFDSVQYSPSEQILRIFFRETTTGTRHEVTITNSNCIGIDYAAGVFTDNVLRAVSGQLTAMLAVIFKAGAVTNGVQRLITDGIITIPGTVG